MNSNKTILVNDKDNVIYYLPSILFNRKKPIKLLFKLPIIIALLIFGYGYYKPNISFIVFVTFFISALIISILSAPRKLVFDKKGLKYHIFWKIKWSNFIDISYDKNELTIKTKNKKNRIIKMVKQQDFDFVAKYLNKKKKDFNE